MSDHDVIHTKDQPEGQAAGEMLTLSELTRAAGVSIRTVRYYIAEGLLPPPIGAGPRAAYTRGHLDRLRLIARLKDAYLPLKEIRRHLAGRSDADIAAELAATGDTAGSVPTARESAGDYIDRVLGPRRAARTRLPSVQDSVTPAPLDITWDRPGGPPFNPARAELHAVSLVGSPVPRRRGNLLARLGERPGEAVEPAQGDAATNPAAPALSQADSWRRVVLSDDAELLIRESANERRRDLVEWLIDWARKVFG
jgi:DNA-binding transcriptional MerR regulator